MMAAGAELTAAAVEDAREKLEAVPLHVPGARISREVRLGSPPRELAAAAKEQAADLILAATHGRTGLTRAVLGSVTSALVRMAHVPVLVLPAELQPPTNYSRVLAAVDLSAVSPRVVEHAARFARTAREGRVRVLSLFEHPLLAKDDELLPHYPSTEELAELGREHEKLVRELVAQAELGAVPVDIEVLSKAPPSRVILDVAKVAETDLIVVGTSGHNALHRFILGSTATRVLAEAGRPVLVVPYDVRQETSAEVLSPACRSPVSPLPIVG